MPFFQLEQYKQLGQPQQGWLYSLTIPTLPAGIVGSADNINLQALSVTVNGLTNTPVEADYYGFKINFTSKMTYTNTFNVNFLLRENWATYKALRQWVNLCQSEVTGVGVVTAALKTTAIVRFYSVDTETINAEFKYKGFYCNSIPAVTGSQDATNLKLDAGFVYDTQQQTI